MVSLEGLKRYAVLGPGGDDQTLQLCLDSAIHWFENAGVDAHHTADPLYELGVYMLALHWYDNRGAIGTASTDNRELPYGVMTIMHQLRY